MPRREYRRPLDDTGLEWLRVRFRTEGGQVMVFTAQYETTIDGDPTPVARFDTAHGFPRFDMLDRRGRVVDKVRLVNQPTLGASLNYALKNIQDMWPRYREAFFKDEQ